MDCRIRRLRPFGVLIESSGPDQDVRSLDTELLRKFFREEQLVLIRGFNGFRDSEDFSKYCGMWGEISEWPFGKILELVEHEKPDDHIFDNSYVPLHWDGMYRQQVPEYQIFHCVKAPLPGHGGRTTFSNTVQALGRISTEQRSAWSRVTGIYERKMAFYQSKTVSPLITKHPHKEYHVIRYNEPPEAGLKTFINPPDLEFKGTETCGDEDFHKGLREVLYHEQNFYAHSWQDGDLVIADNFSLLHGRESFVSRSPRHLRRVQVLSDPPFANPGLESYQ